MALKAVRKRSTQELKEQAQASVNIQNKKGIVKKGLVSSPEVKHPTGDKIIAKVVGLSKGVTLNMENYESMRVDAWLSDSVADDETEMQAFNRISNILTEVLEKTIEEMQVES